ncbi:unnamed protein product [Coffea canephora]|uniref:Uncharacterized protein n=1 Tax=Coffea canephora TaxID=49390 RepID=A0A068VAT0_COFCA|nr:unnamed protein product [Coffea canephora]
MKAIKLTPPSILVGCSSLHVILHSKININLDNSLLLSFVMKSYDPLLNQILFQSDQLKTSRMEFSFALCLGWLKPEIFLVGVVLLNCPADSAICRHVN